MVGNAYAAKPNNNMKTHTSVIEIKVSVVVGIPSDSLKDYHVSTSNMLKRSSVMFL